jgi:predicted AlkP superfamily phosphohydrolase/phosphomutase
MAKGVRRRAIVVVTEGAAPRLLEEWSAAGRLPGFRHLLERGAWGGLMAEVVPYEPPGLRTAFTGRPARDHGWLSYWTVHEPDYRPRVLTPAHEREPFIWHRPELGDVTCAIVNVFGTHPPRPINGWVVSYPMAQTLRAFHPPELRHELRDRGVRCIHDVSVWYEGQGREEFISAVVEADEQRGAIALTLLDQGAELVVVNLTSIDRTSHYYWQELEPGSAVPADDGAMLRAYVACDRIIEALLERVDDGTSLLAFSEIGFGPLRAYCSVNEHLEATGLLERNGSGVEWRKTAAFEAVQGTNGVNVNLRDRYPGGLVARRSYESVREETIDALRSCLNPHTGLPLVSAAQRREEVYGDCPDAPDIVIEPADERYLPLGDPYWAAHVNRRLQSGWHRRRSYWAGLGEGFSHGAAEELASPVDVAPTVYRMLDRQVPPEFAGRPLTRSGG